MRLILDLILIAIVALCAWRGFRNGVIRSICAILAVIVSLYGASIIADVYTEEFTDVFDPFVDGVVDGAVNNVLSDKPDIKFTVTVSEKSDVYKVCFAAMRNIGLSESAANLIATDTASENDRISQDTTNSLSEKLAYKMMNVLIIIIGFILLMIIFAVIGNIINLTFSIPGFEKFEPYVGLALGIVRGILIMYAFASLFRYTGLFIPEETVEKTKLLIKIINNNPIANKMGI